MSKKDFAGALRKTSATQRTVIDERFAMADSVLLGMRADALAARESKPASDGDSSALAPRSDSVQLTTSPAESTGAVVRDTFSMPRTDHGLIEELRVRAARQGRNTNKSEVVRAGLKWLSTLQPDQLVAILDGLDRVKPGRR